MHDLTPVFIGKTMFHNHFQKICNRGNIITCTIQVNFQSLNSHNCMCTFNGQQGELVFCACPLLWTGEKRSHLFTSASDTSHYCRNQFVWRRWIWSGVCGWRFWIYLLLISLSSSCSFCCVPMDRFNCSARSAPQWTLMARAITWSQSNLLWLYLG